MRSKGFSIALGVAVLAASLAILAGARRSGVPAVPAETSVVAATEVDAGHDVRESMTMDEIVKSTGVPRDYIVRYLGLPGCAGGETKPASEWLSKHNLIIEDLREAVDRYRAGFRL